MKALWLLDLAMLTIVAVLWLRHLHEQLVAINNPPPPPRPPSRTVRVIPPVFDWQERNLL